MDEQQIDADSAAVRAVLDGHKGRFAELVKRYQTRVYSTVLRMVGGREAEAEDLTQQAFIEAYSALPRYDQQRSFLTWLLRIAVNNCKDWAKSHKRREHPLELEVDGSSALHAGRIPGPAERLERQRIAQRVHLALEQLELKYRVPVVLRDVEGMSYEEIQHVLDLPLTTLKIRVVRGRAKLQASLADLVVPDQRTEAQSAGEVR